MQIQTRVPARSSSTASQTQVNRQDSTPAPPRDGFLPSNWQANTGIQVGAWGVTSAASALLGSVAGPQVGMLAGGALGAATGIATSAPNSKWYEKALAGVWGFGMHSGAAVIGSASLGAGLAVAAMNGGVSGWAYAEQAKQG